MFGELKEIALRKGLALLQNELGAHVQQKIELFQALQPADVENDEKYSAIIVEPLWWTLKLQSGGAIAAVHKLADIDLEARFRKAMFHIRDELIHVEGAQVVLDPAFCDKVGPTLAAAFKA